MLARTASQRVISFCGGGKLHSNDPRATTQLSPSRAKKNSECTHEHIRTHKKNRQLERDVGAGAHVKQHTHTHKVCRKGCATKWTRDCVKRAEGCPRVYSLALTMCVHVPCGRAKVKRSPAHLASLCGAGEKPPQYRVGIALTRRPGQGVGYMINCGTERERES